MTAEAAVGGPAVVLVVAHDADLGASLATDLEGIVGGQAAVDVVADAVGAISRIREVNADGGIVPVAFVQLFREGDWGVDTAISMQVDEIATTTRTVMITGKPSLLGVDQALQVGAVQGMLTRPWTPTGLRAILLANIATFLVEHSPELLADFDALLDDDDRGRAHQRIEEAHAAERFESPVRHSLLDADVDQAELEDEFVRLLDRALGHPPRLRVSPGTILIEADEDVGGFYMVLDGLVRLSSKTESGERILHERSTGAIVGLLSLASHRRAMQQCRAVTEVRAIPVTLDQLERALAAEPELAGLLMRILISSLARRLRRSDHLQVELDQSLAALSAARAQLVAAAKFATLGEISAGMAHELNNPVAALVRSMEHAATDIVAVVADQTITDLVDSSTSAATLSAGEQRALRRDLAEALGDRHLADQCIEIGIRDVDAARSLARLPPDQIERLLAAARLGNTIRNMTLAAERIQSLVGSLRAYARGDGEQEAFAENVSLEGSIDNALRLVSHRLTDVVVDYSTDDISPITARPGALQQVWTNLITNALDATDDRGTLTISASMPSPEVVLVQFADDGPGIDPELRDRIFEPRFTTKGGRVEFGLGLGLSISRQLVDEHGGTIDVESTPGRTVFSVRLPRTRDNRTIPKGAPDG